MSTKVDMIKALPGYKSHEYDRGRWHIEFVPPSWLDGDGAVINDCFFDDDIAKLRRDRELITEHRRKLSNG
jgi:hypothetical protein